MSESLMTSGAKIGVNASSSKFCVFIVCGAK
jgi:hypothetical protein